MIGHVRLLACTENSAGVLLSRSEAADQELMAHLHSLILRIKCDHLLSGVSSSFCGEGGREGERGWQNIL